MFLLEQAQPRRFGHGAESRGRCRCCARTDAVDTQLAGHGRCWPTYGGYFNHPRFLKYHIGTSADSTISPSANG